MWHHTPIVVQQTYTSTHAAVTVFVRGYKYLIENTLKLTENFPALTPGAPPGLPTGRPEAVAPGNLSGFSLTHHERHLQAWFN